MKTFSSEGLFSKKCNNKLLLNIYYIYVDLLPWVGTRGKE